MNKLSSLKEYLKELNYKEFLNNLDSPSNVDIKTLNFESIDYFGDDSELHIASITNDLDLLSKQLADGKSCSIKNNKGYTPLHFSALFGNYEITKKLLSLKHPINILSKQGDSILLCAARGNNLDCCKLILESCSNHILNTKNDSGFTPLHITCHKGNYEIYKLMIRKGVNIFVYNNYNATPLHWACHSSPKQKNLSILQGKCNIINHIISTFASTSSEWDNYINSLNKIGISALEWCCISGFIPVIPSLLKSGSKIDNKRPGFDSLKSKLLNNIFDEKVLNSIKSYDRKLLEN